MEKIQVIQPTKLLAPYIKQYWFLRIDDVKQGFQRSIPAGCVALVFHKGKQLFLQNDSKLQPQSFICGQSIGFSDVLSTGRIEMITVVFQPYAAKALLHIPVHLFHGKDVAMDEVHAANLLAKYLLDKQHLIIRYLGSDEELTKDHLEGIRNAYHALKQPIDIIPVISDGTYDDLFEKIKDVFKEKIDLLILQSDEMAIPVNKYLKEYHISVPQNVSMVCFGGTSITNVMSPAITSLQYDYEAYTSYVCQCLFAMIEKKMLPEKKPFYRVEEKDSVR